MSLFLIERQFAEELKLTPPVPPRSRKSMT